MKRIIIVLLCFCCLKCGNKKASDKLSNEQRIEIKIADTIKAIDKIDKQIQEGINLYTGRLKAQKDKKALNNKIYTVEFFNKTNPHGFFTEKDTIIVISSLNCRFKYFGYKGIIIFDEHVVAIMDAENTGFNYYDTLSLAKVPLNTLKCVDYSPYMPRRTIIYKVQHAKLIEDDGSHDHPIAIYD
jgi:hypothetical protein